MTYNTKIPVCVTIGGKRIVCDNEEYFHQPALAKQIATVCGKIYKDQGINGIAAIQSAIESLPNNDGLPITTEEEYKAARLCAQEKFQQNIAAIDDTLGALLSEYRELKNQPEIDAPFLSDVGRIINSILQEQCRITNLQEKGRG